MAASQSAAPPVSVSRARCEIDRQPRIRRQRRQCCRQGQVVLHYSCRGPWVSEQLTEQVNGHAVATSESRPAAVCSASARERPAT